MTLAIVPPPETSASFITEDPISLIDLPSWDRYDISFSSAEAAERLSSTFGIDVIRERHLGRPPESDADTPADRVTISWLRRMAQDEAEGQRERLFASAGTLAEINDLIEIAPNFGRSLQVVRTATAAALHTTTPVRIPPLLLLGPPGIGKTFLATRLAKALRTSVTKVDFAGSTTLNPLGGSHRIWRGADIGHVARALISARSASPIFLLDEIDKASRASDGSDPTAALHTLLEAEQAKEFLDDCLGLRFKADECVWVGTANETASIPRSLLDRFLIIDVASPNADQMRSIVRGLFEEIARSRFSGWLEGAVSDEVVDRIRLVHPRRARRIVDLACQMAAAANRTTVTAWDVSAAERLLGGDTR